MEKTIIDRQCSKHKIGYNLNDYKKCPMCVPYVKLSEVVAQVHKDYDDIFSICVYLGISPTVEGITVAELKRVKKYLEK